MYEDLIPGPHEASLLDWNLEMVEKIGQPKLVLQFEVQYFGKSYKLKFESFVLKRDGDVNKKTVDTLTTCGFRGYKVTDIMDNPVALEKNVKYSIDIIRTPQGFWNIEWVNNIGGKSMDKAASKKSLAGYDFSKINGALMKNGAVQPRLKVVKNYAPGTDDNSEIPF